MGEPGAAARQRYLGAALGGLAAAALAEATIEAGGELRGQLGGRGELLEGRGGLGVVVPEARLAALSGGGDALGRAISAVRDAGLPGGDLEARASALGLADALAVAGARERFEEVVAACLVGAEPVAQAAAAGALLGGRLGIQAVPSRFTTYLRHPDGGGLDVLQACALEAMGLAPAPMASPDPATAPVRVDDEVALYASDWHGAAACPRDWALLSLCRTGASTDGHRVRRNLYLVDQEAPEANLQLDLVLADALETIEAWLAEDASRPVVVHCHAGESRTAFVLKAWAMDRYGLDERGAHGWLAASWPRIHRRNHRFVAHLRGLEA